MKQVILCLALLVGTEAFVHQSSSAASVSLKAAPLDDMVGVSVETGDKVFDPLGLAQIHGLIKDDEEHFGVWPSPQWLRESELKHCRVAMLAFVGAIVQSTGVHFPGSLFGQYYEGGKNFISGEALASAFKTCPSGMAQILVTIWLIESKNFPDGAWMGYMDRAPGDFGLNFFNAKNDPAAQLKELKNGRLAMIGIIGLSSAYFIPGSVPFTIPSVN